MHYQPVYTAAVRNPLQHLVDKFPIVGASSTCFLDLGCGRGKALHVARSVLQHASLIGIDLHPNLLADAGRNLGLGVTGEERKIKIGGYIVDTPKIKLILNNVNDVSYDTVLSPYDAVIVFNKNSFDKHTTENTLAKIVSACRGKSVFYIYNNPVFEASFEKFPCVFEMTGWHKNWNTKVFKIY
jgi:SAM-dependent methyltransferase